MKSRNKDKKTHESLIGKIIYGFLLFMPLLAIFTTCAYAIFNKNAYQSFSKEKVELNASTLQINTNSTYYYNFFDDITGQTNNTTPLIRINTINVELQPTTTKIRFSNSNQILEYDANDSLTNRIDNINNCTFTVSENITLVSQPWFKTYLLVPFDLTLDNVFYYSIDKVEESPLFNWAKDSIIYTGLQNTCESLDISNTFMPMLMTYWLIISVLYFLYDIILIIFNVLHRKIHKLQDSI